MTAEADIAAVETPKGEGYTPPKGLREAASDLLDCYVSLANSGDAGHSEPEEDSVVIAMRKAFTIDANSERTFLINLLESAIKTIYFCIAHDRSKMLSINQAMNGKMPRMGTRFLTPKEAGLRFLKQLRTITKEKKPNEHPNTIEPANVGEAVAEGEKSPAE